MKQYTDPTAAALDLLCEPEATQSRKAAILRMVLKSSDGGVLASVPLTFGGTMPVAAYLVLSSSFGGRSVVIMDPDPELAERTGFYARGSDLYHADSADFEELAADIEEATRTAARGAIASGVNTFQAAELLTMGAQCHCVFTGTFVDWAKLAESHIPIARSSHPAARAFVLDVWAHITTQMPLLAEAWNERVA